MPIIKSAKKRVRQSNKRYEANKPLKSFMKNLKKKTLTVVSSGTAAKDEAKKAVDYYKSQLDKAWSKGIYKRNKSSRLKSNIDLLFKKQYSELKK